MKIRVQYKDGGIETISIEGPCTVQHGELLDRLTGPSGEHFFTKDGYYDGWGQSPSAADTKADSPG